MRITQDNFDTLVNNLNHKMTNIENDIRWIKRIGYYMTGAFSLALGKFIIGI